MKVIHINAHGSFSTGNIAKLLIKNHSNEDVFLFSRDDVKEHFAVKYYNNIGFWIDTLLTRITGIDSVWSFSNTRKILKKLNEEEPDIIHLHNLHGFYINYVKLFKYIKKHDIKVIWTLHDCWSFTGHCPHFDFFGCNKWMKQCKKCPLYKQTYLKSWFFDNSSSAYKLKKKSFCGVKDLTIVTPSKWLADMVKQSFLKNYPVKVINNGINTEVFVPFFSKKTKEIIPDNKKVVIAVASEWGKRKGFDDIIEISRRIKDDYIVVIVGVTPQQKEKLSKERIIAITRTENQKQLAELYSMAEVFINTTYEDNYPTVNLEALCCGCPVITYNTGGSIETIDETNGIVVKKGDISEMLESIYNISSLVKDRSSISQNAKNKFSVDIMAELYKKLYERD